jgi:hypothetical protein
MIIAKDYTGLVKVQRGRFQGLVGQYKGRGTKGVSYICELENGETHELPHQHVEKYHPPAKAKRSEPAEAPKAPRSEKPAAEKPKKPKKDSE